MTEEKVKYEAGCCKNPPGLAEDNNKPASANPYAETGVPDPTTGCCGEKDCGCGETPDCECVAVCLHPDSCPHEVVTIDLIPALSEAEIVSGMFTGLIDRLVTHRPITRGDKARRISITVTELEKIKAYFDQTVAPLL